MRDPKRVYALTTYANKALGTNAVGITQTELCTEWRLGERGFCVVAPEHYPPKDLAASIVRMLDPNKPKEQTNAGHTQVQHRAKPKRRNDAP